MISGLSSYNYNKNLFTFNHKKAIVNPKSSDVSFGRLGGDSEEDKKEYDAYLKARHAAKLCYKCNHKRAKENEGTNTRDEKKEAPCMKKCYSGTNIPVVAERFEMEKVGEFVKFIIENKIDDAVDVIENPRFKKRYENSGLATSFNKVRKLDEEEQDEFIEKIKDLDFKGAGEVIGDQSNPDGKQNFLYKATVAGFKEDVIGLVDTAGSGASSVLRKTNSLPSVNARFCPGDCGDGCIQEGEDKPNFKDIELYLGDYYPAARSKARRTGKKVAIVGSGPAGLTAAIDLAKMGHEVKLIDSQSTIGGIFNSHIPRLRVESTLLERIKKYLNELNIEFVPNQKLGEDVSIDQLLGEHNKVIICTGANVPNELNPEETPIKNSRGNKVTSLSGMYNSNKFLTRAKAGKLNNVSGQRVVIIGAGNVAMDAARTALQDLGAKSVRIIYRRAEKDMPATGEEVGKTKDDGATFEFLLSPHKIYEANKNGKIVKKIVFQKTEGTGDYDREGREKVRLVPKSVPNPYKRIEADIIVTALGSHVDTTGLKKMVNLKEEDKLTIDENGKSNIENVFFAGDDTGQTRTAISAMAWAKRTAQTVDEELAAEI